MLNLNFHFVFGNPVIYSDEVGKGSVTENKEIAEKQGIFYSFNNPVSLKAWLHNIAAHHATIDGAVETGFVYVQRRLVRSYVHTFINILDYLWI